MSATRVKMLWTAKAAFILKVKFEEYYTDGIVCHDLEACGL